MDDEVLRRWLNLEGGKVNMGLVAQQVALSRLIAMDEPKAAARDGTVHDFDTDAVARLHEMCPILLRHQLRLPITVWEPSDVAGDSYVEDPAAVAFLVQTGAVATAPRDGRLWMASRLWRAVMDRWPTCFQVLRV